MKEEHYIDLRGQRHILYPGLLALAHERGIQSIDEEILQIPSDANGHLAIVRATVRTKDERTFQGIGDASPESVGRAIRPHLLRMASTRAKARAFRDFVNVAEAFADDPTEEEQPAQGPPRQELGVLEGGATAETPKAGNDQIGVLRTLAEELRGENGVARLESRIGKRLGELTPREADHWIDRLGSSKEAAQ